MFKRPQFPVSITILCKAVTGEEERKNFYEEMNLKNYIQEAISTERSEGQKVKGAKTAQGTNNSTIPCLRKV